MIKRIFAYVVLLLSVSCGGLDRSNPESVAEAFLDAYYGQDLGRAMELATERTNEELRMVVDAWAYEGITAEAARQSAAPFLLEIHGTRLDGDTAYCDYTIRSDRDDANAMPEMLRLVRKNNVWEADF